jgi:hypothetical protein
LNEVTVVHFQRCQHLGLVWPHAKHLLCGLAPQAEQFAALAQPGLTFWSLTARAVALKAKTHSALPDGRTQGVRRQLLGSLLALRNPFQIGITLAFGGPTPSPPPSQPRRRKRALGMQIARRLPGFAKQSLRHDQPNW